MILEKVIVIMMGFSIMMMIQPFIYKMLLGAKCTALNYRGEEIPVGIGIAYVMVQTVVVMISNIYFKEDAKVVYGAMIGILAMGFVGLIDDLMGDKDTKGFKGHIKSLLKGELTTGGLKAVSGFGVSLLISLAFSKGLLEIGLNTVLIALFTNIINLFDLRPGRACKAFLAFGALTVITASVGEYDFMMISAIGVILSYIGYDLGAKSMLGDVGSNAMGVTLGVFCAATSPLYIKFVYLIILIALHLIAEFSSFTKIIEKNKFLKAIDQLGRK